MVGTVIATETHGWQSTPVLAGGAATVALLAAFVVVETHSPSPLVRFSTLLRPRIGLANAIMCVVCAGQFGGFFFVSLYMQRGLGYSPTTTGVAFLPFCVGLVVGIVGSSKLLPRFGARPLLVVGTMLAAIGMLGFSAMDVGAGYTTTVLLPSLAASIGIGLSFVPLSNVATADAPAGEVGMASGMLSASRQIGGSVGLAALAGIAAVVTAESTETAEVALVSGYSRALSVCALLLFAGTVLSLFFPRAPRTTGASPAAEVSPRNG